jgi:hypothetical protein
VDKVAMFEPVNRDKLEIKNDTVNEPLLNGNEKNT